MIHYRKSIFKNSGILPNGLATRHTGYYYVSRLPQHAIHKKLSSTCHVASHRTFSHHFIFATKRMRQVFHIRSNKFKKKNERRNIGLTCSRATICELRVLSIFVSKERGCEIRMIDRCYAVSNSVTTINHPMHSACMAITQHLDNQSCCLCLCCCDSAVRIKSDEQCLQLTMVAILDFGQGKKTNRNRAVENQLYTHFGENVIT